MNSDSASAAPLLVGDIGGTNARFALYDHAGVAAGGGKILVRAVLAASDHAHFVDAVQAFLSANAVPSNTLSSASFAVACPLGVGEVRFTNSPWRFVREELQRSLQLSRLVLVNDFEALALSVPRLAREHFEVLRAGEEASGAPKVVLGPGTGLGVAGIVWQAVPGEGGHVSFAPSDGFEFDLLRFLQARYGRVSVERVLCGDGLAAIHQFLLSRAGVSDLRAITAAAVTTQALAGERLARESVLRFLAALGSFAGDCALMYAARGGVYIGGGIVPRFVSLLEESELLDRFNDKGRMSPWVSQIPLHLLTDERSALRGVAMAVS